MSLQGIFDPVVRAYFENRSGGPGDSGGGSGGPDTDVVCYAFDENKEYAEDIEHPNYGRMIKLSSDTIALDEYEKAIIMLDNANTTGTGDYFTSIGKPLTMQEMAPGLVFGTAENGTPYLMSVHGDIMEQIGLPSDGIWFTKELAGGTFLHAYVLFFKN